MKTEGNHRNHLVKSSQFIQENLEPKAVKENAPGYTAGQGKTQSGSLTSPHGLNIINKADTEKPVSYL